MMRHDWTGLPMYRRAFSYLIVSIFYRVKMARGQSLTQEQIQQLLFPTSYSDSEGEDFDLGIDDDYIQPTDYSSSDTNDEIEEIEPFINCRPR